MNEPANDLISRARITALSIGFTLVSLLVAGTYFSLKKLGEEITTMLSVSMIVVLGIAAYIIWKTKREKTKKGEAANEQVVKNRRNVIVVVVAILAAFAVALSLLVEYLPNSYTRWIIAALTIGVIAVVFKVIDKFKLE